MPAFYCRYAYFNALIVGRTKEDHDDGAHYAGRLVAGEHPRAEGPFGNQNHPGVGRALPYA